MHHYQILKLEKNSQYGYAMTKPMSTGCIKEHHDRVQPLSRNSRFR